MTATPSLPQLSQTELDRFETDFNKHPGMRHMGVRVDLSTPGVIRAVIDPIQPYHRGGLGTEAVNGAVMAGVFDLVTGLVGYLHTGGRRVAVAQLNVQFLRPVNGNRFEVVGRPARVGRTLVFSTAELNDEQGVLCGRCDGIVAVVGIEAAAPSF